VKFNKLLSTIFLLFFTTVASAADYRVMVPFAVGLSSDIITRKIAEVFTRNTGDTLIVENMPGAQALIGTMHWKNDSLQDVYITSTTVDVFEPVLNKNLPYNDKDFNRIIYLGTQSGLWLTRPDTEIKTPTDLLTKMPPFVGGFALAWNQNAVVLSKEKQLNLKIVPYKGINETVQALLAKDIDLAVTGNSPAVMSLVKSGKLKIVGTTNKNDFTLDGMELLSVPKRTGVVGFSAWNCIALKPNLDAKKAAYLKKELWRAVNSPEIKELVESLGYRSDFSNDQKWITQHIANERIRVNKYPISQ
jgi:tripartite-type tricarboxylate transporter receptor subunit TctC